MILDNRFYNKPTLEIAKELLGTYLVNEEAEEKTIGRIVETEAYLLDDPASHSFNNRSERTEIMYGAPGKLYIYFIYGKYYCLNIVTGKKGIAEAVLIRALEPIEGIDLMKRRRKTENIYNFCNGPSKLFTAMGFSKDDYGKDLTDSGVYILSRDSYAEKYNTDQKFNIMVSPRVGVAKAKEELYRFYIKNNPFVSTSTKFNKNISIDFTEDL